MTALRDQAGPFAWTPALAVFDPAAWPGGRGEWHLARCRATPDRLTKLREIQAASQRLWRWDPAAYAAQGYV